MQVYKDKQFIVFKFDDNKTVKYNLSNGETIGKNNRLVKSLNTQLRGYTIQNIIDSISDNNYRNFMNYVNKEVNRSTKRNYYYCKYTYDSNRMVNKITNVGSFLERVKYYSNVEQYFACGFINVDLDTRSRNHLSCPMSEIPKGLIKICKQYNIRLDKQVLNSYNNIPNLYPVLLGMKFNSIRQTDIENILVTYGTNYDVHEQNFNPYTYSYRQKTRIYIKFLVEDYNYNIKSLLTYLDNLMTYEAIEDFEDLINEFYDYVSMSKKISEKYEKYPRYFLSTHRITCRNYNRLKETFVEQDFQTRIKKEYEYTINNYKFIYPVTTQEIKDEAVQQANCVASYIQKVIDGECDIMFLRKRNTNKQQNEQYPDSLVTLEIRDYNVVQAKGKFNRDCTDEEKELIKQFNQYLQKIKNKKQLKESVA